MTAGVAAAVGKEWPATSYEVGREKIREYAAALAIDAGIHRDHDAARAAGTAPIYRGEPGYRDGLDGDSDGIACEPYRGR